MSRFSFVYIGSFLLLLSFFSFINIIYSYYFNIFLSVNTYVATLLISFFFGAFLIFFKKIKSKKILFYEKILTITFGYFFLPLIISLPYYLSIYNISLLDCYFEAISGFTSTGFTVFENIKHIDQSLILWRSTSQWIGGLYFLFSIILLIDIFDDSLKKSLTNYFSLNSSEIFKEVFKIIIVYASLTIFIFIVLKIINLRTFDAFNFSLTIISSGGFLPINNIDNVFRSDVSKIILSLLMLSSYFSLFLFYNIIFLKNKKLNLFTEDLYLLLFLLLILFITFVFFNEKNTFLISLVSICSSVSNLGISFSGVSNNLSFIFLILVIIGGSFFSTSSGLRFIKISNLVKFSINNLLSHTKPNQIYLNKISLINTQNYKIDVNKNFLSIVIFVISLFSISMLLTISNIEFEDSFKLGILTIMNTVNSNMYGLSEFSFNSLSLFPKISLIIFMIIGRVELLSFFILFKKFLSKN